MILIARRAAAQATIDRFQHKTFAWGTEDCAQLLAFHLAALTSTDLSTVFATYTDFLSAKKALRDQGVENLPEYLDKLGFKRIAPAMALCGDLIAFEDDDGPAGLGTMGVHVGENRILLFIRFAEALDLPAVCGACENTRLANVKTAWRAV